MQVRVLHQNIRTSEDQVILIELQVEEMKQRTKICVPSLHLPTPIKYDYNELDENKENQFIDLAEEAAPGTSTVRLDFLEPLDWEQKMSSNLKRPLLDTSIETSSKIPRRELLDESTTSVITSDEEVAALGHEEVHSIPSVTGSGTTSCSKKAFKITRPMPRLRKARLSPQSLQVYRQTQNLKRKARKLELANSSLKKRFREARRVMKSECLQKMMKNLTPFQARLFQSQLRNATKKPRGWSYTIEEKMDAVVLWKSGPQLYKKLNHLGFSLPSTRTLRKVLANIPIEQGLNTVIFNSIKEQVVSMKTRDKYCVLLFDEMSLLPHLEFNQNKDEVIGFDHKRENVADHVTTFMIRGVFKNWKQPIAYYFNKSSFPAQDLAAAYKTLVNQCFEVGLTVLASVCDQGVNNVKAIKMLESETRSMYFLNDQEYQETIIDIDGRKVVALFDTPHLLKSIRNNLLKKDLKFVLDGNRKTASWQHIIKAYNIDRSNNIRVLRKLNDSHIFESKMNKMKVCLAAQVFSQTVASGINDCAKTGIKSADGYSQLDASALDTSDLLVFFDNLFDSLNCFFSGDKPLRSAVSPTSGHSALWMRSLKILESMEFVKRAQSSDRIKPPVLSGWIRNVKGMMLLKKILLEIGEHKFSTRMFNQDPLENFFGQVRQYGLRNINPSCAAFSTYYKSLIIRNIRYHPQGSSCMEDSATQFISLKNMISHGEENVDMDHWHPPEVSEMEVSAIEEQAISYVQLFA